VLFKLGWYTQGFFYIGVVIHRGCNTQKVLSKGGVIHRRVVCTQGKFKLGCYTQECCMYTREFYSNWGVIIAILWGRILYVNHSADGTNTS